MALIKCSKCGNMVSDKASSCPKCGTPIINNKSYCKNADTNNDKLKIEEPLKNKRTNTTSFIGRHFFLYAALIVVLVVGFIGTWRFFNNDNRVYLQGLLLLLIVTMKYGSFMKEWLLYVKMECGDI